MNARLNPIRGALLLFAAVAGCTSGSDAPAETATVAEVASLTHEESVARGEYLVETVAGCPVCHTALDAAMQPVMEEKLAGGLEFEEPAGLWRSLNITPDEETGIGSWSDEEIADAIREGRRPDGSRLYAVMPYMVYNNISDTDIQAMVDYLRTVPAVSKSVERATDHQFPYVPAPPAKGAEPNWDDAIERGAYLANLMHCVECHTPIGPEGPDHERAFAGGMPFAIPPIAGTGMLWSANLTSDESGIAHYTEADVITALTEMKKPDGSPIMGPMAFYVDRWSNIRDDDISALAKFIKSLAPIENQVPASTFQPLQ